MTSEQEKIFEYGKREGRKEIQYKLIELLGINALFDSHLEVEHDYEE